MLRLASPDAERLVQIVDRHFPELTPEMRSLVAKLAHQVTDPLDDERPVSTAEFIDLVKVIVYLSAPRRSGRKSLDPMISPNSVPTRTASTMVAGNPGSRTEGGRPLQ